MERRSSKEKAKVINGAAESTVEPGASLLGLPVGVRGSRESWEPFTGAVLSTGRAEH